MAKRKTEFLQLIAILLLVGIICAKTGLVDAEPQPVDAPPPRLGAEDWIHLPIVFGTTQDPVATSTPTATPTATPTETPTMEPPSDTGDVRITKIFFDGAVPQVESDEYVEIENFENRIIRLGGWELHDAGQTHTYTFPSFAMNPGQVCRVYTNENHPEWCGFNWGNGSAIWNNSGDEATLKDSSGTVIDTCSYSGSGPTASCP